jgi:hypothetical protein
VAYLAQRVCWSAHACVLIWRWFAQRWVRAEIVEQAVFARRLFSEEFGSITNVVFMVSILFMVT